jgi:hypothetical protein
MYFLAEIANIERFMRYAYKYHHSNCLYFLHILFIRPELVDAETCTHIEHADSFLPFLPYGTYTQGQGKKIVIVSIKCILFRYWAKSSGIYYCYALSRPVTFMRMLYQMEEFISMVISSCNGAATHLFV